MSKYDFQIAVQTQYLPGESLPHAGVYSFAYTITITNRGQTGAQLIARYWTIRDANGQTEEVKGLGVVGEQPLLQPGESFRYTSGCRLRAASGTMHGRYLCVAEDGTAFDSAIPMFILESTEDHGPPGHAPQNRTLH